ncbi:hypothetical protein [Antarctobacter jejuensis]|uniref:hypothetical protein n=1 Tax=Antarctobacter jejuensis TaxID=1439938 RepID=UPI003FCF8162
MFFTRFTALAAGFVLFATPTLSETIDAAGTGHGKSTATPVPVSEGLVMVHATSMYDRFETEDPNNPFASAKGPCFGSILIDKGAVSGEGLCHYTDGDGDVAAIKWMAKGMSAEGRTQGDWMVLGGTGKWATTSGGGTFDAGGDPYTNNVTGEMTRN